jgi:hypothetical protein
MTTAAVAAPLKYADPERGHKRRVRLFAFLAITLVVSLLIQGFQYYRMPLNLRHDSPQHDKLKPSGTIGVKLGVFGVMLFGFIFLYPLRKRWMWLMRKGNSKHWLDFHIVMGLTAPWIIACHASFKFRGFAGLSFFIMSAVAASGVVGRYLYNQIPRRVNSSELSLQEAKELQEHLVKELAEQKFFDPEDLKPLFRLPTEEQARKMPIIVTLLYMAMLDIMRPFQVARLRLRTVSPLEIITSFGGLLHTHHAEVEIVIDLARAQASLSKRLVFLSRAQQIFHLWHVVHRPFSFSFVCLAVIHIGVVTALGFVGNIWTWH